MNNRDVYDDEFISMMSLWVHKNGIYPLELITFLETSDKEKVIAIPDYSDSESTLFLGEKSYPNYEAALSKVGALMDKMDYSRSLNIFKSSHPLSCPAFYAGVQGVDKEIYLSAQDVAEWEAGRNFALSEELTKG